MASGDKVGIEKLPPDEDGNEQFWIVYYDAERRATQPGYVRQTSRPMSENDIREFFSKAGQPAHEVEEMFRSARANYKQ